MHIYKTYDWLKKIYLYLFTSILSIYIQGTDKIIGTSEKHTICFINTRLVLFVLD